MGENSGRRPKACDTIIKIMRFISILFFITIGHFVWAEEPRYALDNTPSVETAAVPASKAATPGITPGASAPAIQEQAPSSYVYDLKKLIIQSRENIKRVNAKIKDQAVIKRNQKREERAREYYQRGMQLTDEGKFDEAREYFEKAVSITDHPEMIGYIKESERRLKLQEQAIKHQKVEIERQNKEAEIARAREKEVWRQEIDRKEKERKVQVNQQADKAYNEAVALYKDRKFAAAKEKFQEVEWVVPDYKAGRNY